MARSARKPAEVSSVESWIGLGGLGVGAVLLVLAIALWRSADRFLAHSRPMVAQVEAVRWQEVSRGSGIARGNWVMTFAVELPDGRHLRSEWHDLRLVRAATSALSGPPPTYGIGAAVPVRVVATDPPWIEPDDEALIRLAARNTAQAGLLCIVLGVVFLLGDMVARRFGR